MHLLPGACWLNALILCFFKSQKNKIVESILNHENWAFCSDAIFSVWFALRARREWAQPQPYALP